MFPIFVKAEKYRDWEIGGLGFFYEVLALSKNKEELTKIKWKKFFVGLIHKAIILCKKKGHRPPKRISAAKKSVIFSLTVYEEEAEVPDEMKEVLKERMSPEMKELLIKRSLWTLPEIEELAENSIYGIMKNTEMAEGRGIGYVWILTNNRELASKLSWGNGICGSKAEVKMLSFDTDFSVKICPLVVIGPNS